MIQCASCQVEVDQFDTYFSDIGTVCVECHTHEEVRDREEFRRGEDQNYDLFSSRMVTQNESYVDDEGRRVSVSTTVDFGIFTRLHKVLKALFRK